MRALFKFVPYYLSPPIYTAMRVSKNLKKIIVLFLLGLGAWIIFFLPPRYAPIENYGDAKHILEKEVFYDHRVTLYCGANFNQYKHITVPEGFETRGFEKRVKYMEWEHVVPAEKFGRTFSEWREGSEQCIHNNKSYRGRKCAEKASARFRKIESDLYNLYPAIGAVNATRGDKQYASLPEEKSQFGSCDAKKRGREFEPPDRAKGIVARISLYMAKQYPEIKWDKEQEELFNAWNLKFPVDKWECIWAKRIEKIQGNANNFVKGPCKKAGLW